MALVMNMRLDKFLKISRIIKRRSVACDACSKGAVCVNGKQAKASCTLKEGDVIQVTFGDKMMSFRVKSLKEIVGKNDADTLYEVIEQ